MRWLVCAKKAGISPSGKRASPAKALEFAEILLLCPSEDAAMTKTLADPAGAAAFDSVAAHFLADAQAGIIQAAPSAPRLGDLDQTPFHSLASAVIEFCEGLRDLYPDQFQ